jgi:hypothetical protein
MPQIARGLVALAVALVLSSCDGNSNPGAPTPMPTPSATPTPLPPGDWFQLESISPARGSIIRPSEGQLLKIKGAYCQPDPAQVLTLAFISDDGSGFAPYREFHFPCTDLSEAEWVASTERSDQLMKWARGHRLNAAFLVGRRPLTAKPGRNATPRVVWANVVTRIDIALDWHVEP